MSPSPDKSGCGAIDGAPTVVVWAAEHRDAIAQQFEALGVQTDGLDEVLDNYAQFAGKIAHEDYHGADVMQLIVSRGKMRQTARWHFMSRLASF